MTAATWHIIDYEKEKYPPFVRNRRPAWQKSAGAFRIIVVQRSSDDFYFSIWDPHTCRTVHVDKTRRMTKRSAKYIAEKWFTDHEKGYAK